MRGYNFSLLHYLGLSLRKCNTENTEEDRMNRDAVMNTIH